MKKFLLLVFPLVFAFVLGSSSVFGATNILYSDEVTGTGVTSRANVDLQDDAWRADVTAQLGVAPTDFETGSVATPGLPNVLTTSNGITVDVMLHDMTNFAVPTDLGVPATTQGSLGSTSSNTMQDSSPKPQSLLDLSEPYYNEITGATTSRNGLIFSFSEPVTNFGAWFGDVETRTDGGGTPAVLRLLDAAGNQIGTDLGIEPMPSDPAGFDQTQCGAPGADSFRGCGNRATRWIGFSSDPSNLVSKMVLIVGDDDTTVGTEDGNTEHMSFMGATMAVFTPEPSLDIVKETSSNTELSPGIYETSFDITLTNDGNVPLEDIVLTDDLAGHFSSGPALQDVDGVSNGSATLLTPPTSADSSITMDTTFDETGFHLITQPNTLDVGDTFTVRITVTVDVGTFPGPYFNGAEAITTYGEEEIYISDTSEVIYEIPEEPVVEVEEEAEEELAETLAPTGDNSSFNAFVAWTVALSAVTIAATPRRQED